MADDRRIPRWLWAIWGVSALLIAGIAANLSPWLLGDNDWRWTYQVMVTGPARFMLVAGLLAAYIVTAAWWWPRIASDRAAWRAVAVAAAMLLIVQVALPLIAHDDPLRALLWRTTSPDIGGYHDAATGRIDGGARALLTDFPTVSAGFREHPARHPPGLTLYFVLAQNFFEAFPNLTAVAMRGLLPYRCEFWEHLYRPDSAYAAALGGLLAIPITALLVVPLYAVGRKLIGQRRALAAVLLAPLVPGFVRWAPGWDAPFALLTAALLWLLHAALVERRRWAWPAAGLLLSVGTFFQHSVIVLIGFAGLYTLLHLWQARDHWLAHWQPLAVDLLAFGVGMISVWLVYGLATGITWLDVWQANTAAHFEMPHNYFVRLLYNPYDYVLFLGFPLGLLGMVAVINRAGGRGHAPRQPHHTAAHPTLFIFATVLTFTILVLSGIARAEVGRVWILLMPLSLLVAAAVRRAFTTPRRLAITAALLAVQTLTMQSVLFLMQPVPPTIDHTTTVPADLTPVDATFTTPAGVPVALAAFDMPAHAAPGGMLPVRLAWHSEERPAAYGQQIVTFAHLLAPDGTLAAQADSEPRDGLYPLMCWLPGEVVTDTLSIALPPDLPPGRYRVVVGMYTFPDIVRLPAAGSDVTGATVTLGTVTID